jgi:hypothetical protein
LLAGLAFEAQVRLEHEVGAGGLQSLCHRLPVGQRQDEPEMRHRHPVLADMAGGGGLERLAQVQGDLVAEEVEIDPGGGAAALCAAQHAAVEAPRHVQVGDVEGEMKQAAHPAKDSAACWAGHRAPVRAKARIRPSKDRPPWRRTS